MIKDIFKEIFGTSSLDELFMNPYDYQQPDYDEDDKEENETHSYFHHIKDEYKDGEKVSHVEKEIKDGKVIKDVNLRKELGEHCEKSSEEKSLTSAQSVTDSEHEELKQKFAKLSEKYEKLCAEHKALKERVNDFITNCKF